MCNDVVTWKLWAAAAPLWLETAPGAVICIPDRGIIEILRHWQIFTLMFLSISLTIWILSPGSSSPDNLHTKFDNFFLFWKMHSVSLNTYISIKQKKQFLLIFLINKYTSKFYNETSRV